MANTRSYKQTFNGGEVSPDFWGQLGDGKYQSGAATLRNMIALPHGPAQNRCGFAFVRECKYSDKLYTRLIPFEFSTDDTLAIEMGEGYFRFHSYGQTVLCPTGAAWSSVTAYTVGNLVSSGGVNYYCLQANTNKTPATEPTYWYAEPATGEYEVPNNYLDDELLAVHYVQSADVLTLVHQNHPPAELRRYGATDWRFADISFAPSVSLPTSISANAYNVPAGNTIAYSYKVTSVATDGVTESAPSSAVSCNNNLYGAAANNIVTWVVAPSGVSFYNVYRRSGGLYGYVGSATAGTFVDDNIAPDMSKTPPNIDTVFASPGDYPGAVSYFEQRRCFAGTINQPQNLWMTKTGTESIMTYGLPVMDTDRVAIRVAAREASTITHLVPLQNLLALTDMAEWLVSSGSSDAITPNSIAVRPQSYVGASPVQPQVINNTIIYAAARGGHVRELGYSWQANGFTTGDLSLRASHLFDDNTIWDMTYAKSPYPVVWCTNTRGQLLGLTYVPDQSVGAWHHHDTDGSFGSICAISEDSEDRLYAIITREIEGVTRIFVERMGSRKLLNPGITSTEAGLGVQPQYGLPAAFFVDCGYTKINYSTGIAITVTGGTTWGPGETLTVTAASPLFAYPATTDVGDKFVLTTDGTFGYLGKTVTPYTIDCELTITSVTSTTVATVTVSKVLPVFYRGTPFTGYYFARDTVSGLTWLEGKTVSILADGAVHPQRVVTGGSITLDQPAIVVQVGLPYDSDTQTLPLALATDNAYGQGRNKNISKAFLRVFRSSGIYVGPDSTRLVQYKQRTTEPYGSPPNLKTEEIDVVLTPSWENQGGQIFIRQSDPLPLTIVSCTLMVTVA